MTLKTSSWLQRGTAFNSSIVNHQSSIASHHPCQAEVERAPLHFGLELHRDALAVVTVPNPYTALVLHGTGAGDGAHPHRGEHAGRSFDRLASLHRGRDFTGGPAVVDREYKALPRR